MMTYREMVDERNDEIMCDVRERQAHVMAMQERYKDDPEGYKRWQDALFARAGFRLEPIGDTGMSRMVDITD
jgi:hypothetical protein